MTCLELESRDCREGSIPVLETERLILRAPKFEDVKPVAALANDKRIAENTRRIPHPYSQADAEDFIAAANVPHGDIAFLIATRDGAPIGVCSLSVSSLAGGDRTEIGYWLGVPFWNRGYATEAVRALIDFAFADLDHERLLAGVRVTNPASRRVLEKCGFQWTGVNLARIPALHTSAPIDRFRLDRSVWSGLRARSIARPMS